MNQCVLKSATLVLFLFISLFAESTAYLEKRIVDLEKRIRQMEIRLLAVENSDKSSGGNRTTTASNVSKVSTSGLLYAKLIKKKLDIKSGDNLALLISFHNNSYKNIAGFSGELNFTTTSGEELLSFDIDINKVIPRNGEISWYGGVGYIASDRGQVRLLNMHVSTIRTDVRIKYIYYTDGTSKKFN